MLILMGASLRSCTTHPTKALQLPSLPEALRRPMFSQMAILCRARLTMVTMSDTPSCPLIDKKSI
jgi:hypothetical protein